MSTKLCPFAILARQSLRLDEMACLTSSCAVWTGSKCGFLAVAKAMSEVTTGTTLSFGTAKKESTKKA